jgi:hypothetical protein
MVKEQRRPKLFQASRLRTARTADVPRRRRPGIAGLLTASALVLGCTVAATVPAAATTASGSPAATGQSARSARATANPKASGLMIANTQALTNPTSGPYASVTPDATDSHGCPDGDFCAWPAQGFSDGNADCPAIFLSESLAPAWFDWAAYSGDNCIGDPGTWSWDNNGPYRVWKQKTMPASDDTWCISPHVSNGDVGDNITREDGWIQLTTNTAACPQP